MPAISSSVGTGGANAPHDVMLVQLMLASLKKADMRPYFGQSYVAPYSPDTTSAIIAFQRTGTGEPKGLISPGGATWKALSAAFAAAAPQRRDVRASQGIAFAYLSMPASKLSASLALISAAKLQTDFRNKVAQLVQKFYDASSIVWSIVPSTGGWRSFDGQEGVVTDAGFGESIHQYGYAADLAVVDLSWIAPDLTDRKLLTSSKLERKFQLPLYAARNTIATALKLFPTTKEGDLGHVQYFDDSKLDSVSSLMALMHVVGPKAMNWKPWYMTPTDYLCDLGLGGDLYFVGTSSDIWKYGPQHITPDDLAIALRAKKKSDPRFSPNTFLSRTGLPELPAASDISAGDIAIVQKMLRAEFDAAAANWKLWKPVYYPDATRRPKNPHQPPKKARH